MADKSAPLPDRSPSDSPPTYDTATSQPPPPYRRPTRAPSTSGISPAPAHLPIKTATTGDTYIEATLDKLKWGQFNGRPACLLSVKLAITEPAAKSTLFSAHCTLTFSQSSKTDGPGLQIVKHLPVRLAGPKVKPTNAAYSVEIGADTPYSTLRSSWGLEGDVKVGEGGKRSAVWDVTSDLSTTAPLPRVLRLGVIVDLDGRMEGGLEVEVEVRGVRRSLLGSLMRPRGDSARGVVTVEGGTGEGVVTEGDLKGVVSSMFT